MDQLIAMISEKTGISTEQAKGAADTVLEFLKDKLPAGIGDKLKSFIDSDGDGEIELSDVTDKLGGLFK